MTNEHVSILCFIIMSADLFAEFNEPATNSAPQKQPQQSPSFPSTPSFGIQNHNQNNPAASDPFSWNTGSTSSFTQPEATSTTPWPATQSQQYFPSVDWSSAGWGHMQSQQQPDEPEVQADADEDDTWGDFEVAEPTQPAGSSTNSQPMAAWGLGPAAPSLPSQSPQHSMASQQIQQYSQQPPTQQQPSQSLNNVDDFGFGGNSSYVPPDYNPSSTTSKPKDIVASKASDPNVLFDAEDFELDDTADDDGFDEEEDDFGAFETVQPASSKPVPQQTKPVPAVVPAPTQSMPSMDLLSLDDSAPSIAQSASLQQTPAKGSSIPSSGLRFGALHKSQPSKPTNSVQPSIITSRITAASVSQSKPVKAKASAAVDNIDAWGADENDESWASWDDGPSSVPTAAPTTAIKQSETWGWDDSSSRVDTPAFNDSAPPPVNVPPPSIILSTFRELFKLGEPLFKTIAGQNSATKQQVLSNPKTVDFIKGYIMLATTAGRVIAGRKQRWHRDKILAKSMSISAAGSKGMKLAGVDKTQSAREDREAADVVAAWREYVGRLRSAVIIVNSSANAGLKVPELSETILVQTAKVVPTAPKPCVICGLKRDERVNKVDFEVEDSFGEWWVDHWGHRACKNFWIEHEKKLRQR